MKALYTLAFGIALGVGAKAQDWNPELYRIGQVYEGEIVTSDGEVRKGFIKALDRTDMQEKVIFYTEKGNKKTLEKFKYGQLQGYRIGEKEYKSIAYSGGLMAKPVRYVLKVKDGAISEFIWYNKVENFNMLRQQPNETYIDYDNRRYESDVVFHKDDGQTKSMNALVSGFAKKMSAFIADHEELANKVKNKEKGYKALKILDIIEEYNAWRSEQ